MEPHERIREALKEKTRGFRGPKMEREFVEVFAGDVVSLADTITNPTPEIAQLRKGSLPLVPEMPVTIYADHAFALLDAAKPKAPDKPLSKDEP